MTANEILSIIGALERCRDNILYEIDAKRLSQAKIILLREIELDIDERNFNGDDDFYCPRCREKLNLDVNYCYHCGQRIKAKGKK